MVGHFVVLSVRVVCQTHKELTARESVEVLGCISLNPLFVPNLGLFALSVDFSNKLVEVRSSVHRLPQRFAVLRVVAAAVVLLCAVVNERDTSTSQGKDHSVL